MLRFFKSSTSSTYFKKAVEFVCQSKSIEQLKKFPETEEFGRR